MPGSGGWLLSLRNLSSDYLRGWFEGEFAEDLLTNNDREAFKERLAFYTHVDNIYPIQLQKCFPQSFLPAFKCERTAKTDFRLQFCLQDPSNAANSMLRHYLSLTGYLRLTRWAYSAAGMITRLEAFKNTCLQREALQPEFYSARTKSVADRSWEKSSFLSLHIMPMFLPPCIETSVSMRMFYREQDKIYPWPGVLSMGMNVCR